MSNPIVRRQELSRLPLQRRPLADPGTSLVFQTRRGELVGADHVYTSGEVFWRGYRTVYTVDTKPHGEAFTCRLPTRGGALHFDASVTYNWTVTDAIKVVQNEFDDPAASCREYLTKEMRRICRQVNAIDDDPTDRAEQLIDIELGEMPIRLAGGITVSALHAALSLDQAQLEVATELAMGKLTLQRDSQAAHSLNEVERIRQDGELRRRLDRIEFYEQMTGGNRLVASILAEDPAKATETVQLMASMEQQKRGEAIRAMEVIIKGGHLQIGDLDPAISAVVSQFTSLVSDVNATIAGGPQVADPQIAGPAADDTGTPS